MTTVEFEIWSIIFKDGFKLPCLLVKQDEGGYCLFSMHKYLHAVEYHETKKAFVDHYKNSPDVKELIQIA